MRFVVKNLLIPSIVIVIPTTTAAQDSAEACTLLENDAERLICYDSVHKTKIETVAPTASTGNWRVSTETNRMTDTKDVYLSISSEQPVPVRYAYEGENKAQLTIRCQENTTALTIWFGGQFMASSGGYGDVTYRIDDNKAVTRGFEESTSNEHLGLWSGGSSIPMIKSMLGATNLIVSATPFNENSVTLDFVIAGLEEAIKPLRDACAW